MSVFIKKPKLEKTWFQQNFKILSSCVLGSLPCCFLCIGSGAVCHQLQWINAHREAAVHCGALPSAPSGSPEDGPHICPEDFQRGHVWGNSPQTHWGYQVLKWITCLRSAAYERKQIVFIIIITIRVMIKTTVLVSSDLNSFAIHTGAAAFSFPSHRIGFIGFSHF